MTAASLPWGGTEAALPGRGAWEVRTTFVRETSEGRRTVSASLPVQCTVCTTAN